MRVQKPDDIVRVDAKHSRDLTRAWVIDADALEVDEREPQLARPQGPLDEFGGRARGRLKDLPAPRVVVGLDHDPRSVEQERRGTAGFAHDVSVYRSGNFARDTDCRSRE